jgi:hypothetical protein
VIDGIINVDIIGDNAGLDTPFLPSLFGPLGLGMQVLVHFIHFVLFKDMKA